MKKQAVVVVCVFLLTGLAACNAPVYITPDSSRPTEQPPYNTVSVLLTSTAGAEVVANTPVITLVAAQPQPTAATPENTPAAGQPIATLAVSTQISPTLTLKTQVEANILMICNMAHPGRPIDITIPDETRFAPGEYFSKTWRLVNGGACPWTPEYSVVWFSGEDMGISRAQPLLAAVAPGTSLDVTVDMVAPMQPGVYQSNWKLRDDRGELFGIGPTGDSPFWVRIVVVPVDTPTVTPAPPDATETPLVYSGGVLTLLPTDGVDLDSVQLNQSVADDLLLETSETSLVLLPVNGAKVAFYGTDGPEQSDCMLAVVTEQPLDLAQIQPGAFMCYRTTQGLPGRAYLAAVDPQTGQVDLEFLTWAVP